MVGYEGAPLPHWPRLACGRVLRGLQFELGIDLSADQERTSDPFEVWAPWKAERR